MTQRRQLALVAAILPPLAALGLSIARLAVPRVITYAVTSDGTEFCVLQTCNWSPAEPFTTSAYYRKPDGNWGWFYYDHEDSYWGHARADIDNATKRISILRDGKLTATFDWEPSRFRLLRADFPERDVVGAQKWMPSGWDIPKG
jgi:hypothetical protein